MSLPAFPFRADVLGVGYVCGWGTVLGRLGRNPSGFGLSLYRDLLDRTSNDGDLPYVVQEDRMPAGQLSLIHGSYLCPAGTDSVLTDLDDGGFL